MDYGAIISLAGSLAKGAQSSAAADSSNAQMMGAYDEMLRNLRERFADYDALGKAGYQDIEAQQLGPSALEGIQNDPQARMAQQEALAALSELAANGGLSLADMQALNEIQRNLNQNSTARQKGLANDFAARGQLGAGAQLAMGLQGQQQAAESANQRGESVAAQAQARALQAILQKGQMGRAMGNDDWQRKASAAQAKDAIEARNAAARTDAGKYNNSLKGQAFEDEIAKARGKTSLTNSMNEAIGGKGAQGARTTAAKSAFINDAIDAGAGAVEGLTSGDGEKSGGGSDGVIRLASDDPNWTYKYGTDYGESDPSEWKGWGE